MKNNFQTILLLAVLAMTIYSVFSVNDLRTNIKQYKTKIDKIQNKIDSTQTVNLELKERVSQINKNIYLLSDKINSVNNDIKQIKKNTDEKVNAIDTIGFNELERFFSDRYK